MLLRLFSIFLALVGLVNCQANDIIGKLASGGSGKAFVTSLQTAGDLTGFTTATSCGGGNAIETLNCTCQYLAGVVLLSNHTNFRAWVTIADPKPTAPESVDAQCNISDLVSPCSTGAGPWNNMNGDEIGENINNLNSTGLTNPVNFNERGESYSGMVWTGTNYSSGLEDCEDWSDATSAKFGTFGLSTATTVTDWTSNGTITCAQNLPFYCFELIGDI